MKVYINGYKNHWLSPYTIMEKVLFWKKWTDPEFDLYDDKNNHYTDWLVKPMTLVQKFLDIVDPKINYVKIDKYDTWSMDHTLSLIILPMLKQLKATKHGAPNVDDEDVPEELKSTSAPAKENEYDVDANHFKRWDWILDEMIWAHEQKNKDDWSDQFYTGVADYIHVEVEEPHEKFGKVYRMEHGPNHTQQVDWDGMKAHQDRMRNGMRLFGKYYEGLWD
jgi:hypothetical protein